MSGLGRKENKASPLISHLGAPHLTIRGCGHVWDPNRPPRAGLGGGTGTCWSCDVDMSTAGGVPPLLSPPRTPRTARDPISPANPYGRCHRPRAAWLGPWLPSPRESRMGSRNLWPHPHSASVRLVTSTPLPEPRFVIWKMGSLWFLATESLGWEAHVMDGKFYGSRESGRGSEWLLDRAISSWAPNSLGPGPAALG